MGTSRRLLGMGAHGAAGTAAALELGATEGAVAGASERTLARLFLRETGVSFRERRLRLRLLAALTALEEGTSVTAVALDSGYDSPSAFIAAFKRVFGGTPTQLFRPDGS